MKKFQNILVKNLFKFKWPANDHVGTKYQCFFAFMTAYKLEKHWYPPQHTVSRVLMLIGHVPLFYMQGQLNIQ